MAMVSPLPCCCCASLARFPSPMPSSERWNSRPTRSAASLRFHRSECRAPKRSSAETRRQTTSRHQFRGVAFASIRDAEELVQAGVIRPVSPKDVSGLLSEGYVLLDVRPIWEREKAYVAGSYHVPLFVEDLDTGALTLIKRGIQAGQGGWWLGQKLTTRNEKFVEQVQAAVPKDQKLVVACGEGLRSLLALEDLNDAGFEQLAWLAGGFNRVRDHDYDFPKVEGPTELRFATIGGASQYVLKFALFVQGVINLVNGRKSVDST